MKMKLTKNKKDLQQKFSRKVLLPKTIDNVYVYGQQEVCPFYM